MDKPAPTFSLGQRVRIRVNQRNHTPREGCIREIIWHHKDAKYNYYLQDGSRKVSKRYFEEDLEPVD